MLTRFSLNFLIVSLMVVHGFLFQFITNSRIDFPYSVNIPNLFQFIIIHCPLGKTSALQVKGAYFCSIRNNKSDVELKQFCINVNSHIDRYQITLSTTSFILMPTNLLIIYGIMDPSAQWSKHISCYITYHISPI
jgi:hypothetical protein